MFKKDDIASNEETMETVVGPSVVVEGDFVSKGPVTVFGSVVGSLKTVSDLKIGKEAHISAHVEARNGLIAGEITGNVTCEDQLDIKATGKITGDLVARIISIEAGAIVVGRITVLTDASVGEGGES